MRNKQFYLLAASFAALIFLMLGYVVKFYPDLLTAFDSSVQEAVRGDLPRGLTAFFRTVTTVGNTGTQAIIAICGVYFCYAKKWYAEAGFVTINSLLAALCVLGLKYLYQRPRPSLSHLVYAGGYSFPSGHSLGSLLIIGSLIVIIHQRMKKRTLRLVFELLLSVLIAVIGLSRIYLGVHYPSDVLAGFIFALGILSLIYPFYDQKRFEWRFQGRQK